MPARTTNMALLQLLAPLASKSKSSEEAGASAET